MDFTRFNRLLASSTYRELGLRSKEYLQYLNAGGVELVCAVHPYGYSGNSCPDYQAKRKAA